MAIFFLNGKKEHPNEPYQSGSSGDFYFVDCAFSVKYTSHFKPFIDHSSVLPCPGNVAIYVCTLYRSTKVYHDDRHGKYRLTASASLSENKRAENAA